MSPAPVRQRTTADRFPYGWGYALGLVLVAAGIAVAVWGLVTGVGGFASDVNDLRRVLDGSALEASLEAGDEVVYEDAPAVGEFFELAGGRGLDDVRDAEEEERASQLKAALERLKELS